MNGRHPVRPPIPLDVYMKLEDPRKLARIIAIEGVSMRSVARAAGWSSHTYLQRLLRGEVNTLRPEPAMRIAAYLHVAVDDIFVAKLSSANSHLVTRQGAA